jgi:hypothetical protein
MGVGQAQISHPESRKKRQKAINPGFLLKKPKGLSFSPFTRPAIWECKLGNDPPPVNGFLRKFLPSCSHLQRPHLALLVFKQVENIRANLRWIGIPTLFPVPINFPTNPGKPMSVLGTPLAKLGMGVTQACIRPEMGGRHDAACGQLRAMDTVITGKPFGYLRADFNQACIQIQSNVASRTREACRTNERPDFATSSGNELRQVLRWHAAFNYSGENRPRIRHVDIVGHTVIELRIAPSRKMRDPRTARSAVPTKPPRQ